MIFNLIRTTLELSNYLDNINYPKARIITYSVTSIVLGILLSGSSKAAELPILTLTAILFGFTINAVVLLGNSSEHYLSSDSDYSEDLEKFYKKSLYISIHTLGIGILTIIITGVFQLFPNFDVWLVDSQLYGHTVKIELISSSAYAFTVYYLIVFSIVIASTAELVKIRV